MTVAMLHRFAPTEHCLHLAKPDRAVLTIFWQIWIALVYLIAGGAFVAGALVAYALVFVRASLRASRSR